MDWTDDQQCVVCDKSGNLLVCNNDGCPISVHKNCMGCEAHFDDVGNFHCPYCVYKHYMAEASRLGSKAMLTKKALSAFLEAEKRDDNHQEPVDKSVDENHDTLVPEKTNEGFNRNEEIHGGNDENSCRMMVVYNPNPDRDDACNRLQPNVSKMMKVDQQTRDDDCKSRDVDQQKHDGSIEELAASILLTIRKENTCKKRNISVRFNMNGSKEESVMDRGVKNRPNELPMMIHREKRSRVLWSEQEEEMLKEGVQRYSQLTKKNLPWKKILDFGRHVFNSSRTPSELKDKWRKLGK